MLTTSSGKSRRGIGWGISIAEGSTGASKPPHGYSGVAVGSGVGVDVATAGEVAVGGAGMKGVGVNVALGSLVTSGLSCCKAPGNTAAEPQDVRLKTKRSVSIL